MIPWSVVGLEQGLFHWLFDLSTLIFESPAYINEFVLLVPSAFSGDSLEIPNSPGFLHLPIHSPVNLVVGFERDSRLSRLRIGCGGGRSLTCGVFTRLSGGYIEVIPIFVRAEPRSHTGSSDEFLLCLKSIAEFHYLLRIK